MVHHHSADNIFWSFGIFEFIQIHFENRFLLQPVLGDMVECESGLLMVHKPAIAAMHGPHSVFDIVHCAIICRRLTNEKQRKIIFLLDVSINR